MSDATDAICKNCAHWARGKDGGPLYNDLALQRNPEWAKRGLCEHPQSMMHPEWDGAEAISTEPDFGCVQFDPGPTKVRTL